jgi:hypothetical protein
MDTNKQLLSPSLGLLASAALATSACVTQKQLDAALAAQRAELAAQMAGPVTEVPVSEPEVREDETTWQAGPPHVDAAGCEGALLGDLSNGWVMLGDVLVKGHLFDERPELCATLADDWVSIEEKITAVRTQQFDDAQRARAGRIEDHAIPRGALMAVRTTEVRKGVPVSELDIKDPSLQGRASAGSYPVDVIPFNAPVDSNEDLVFYFIMSSPTGFGLEGAEGDDPFTFKFAIPQFRAGAESDWHVVSSGEIDASLKNVAYRWGPVVVGDYALSQFEGEMMPVIGATSCMEGDWFCEEPFSRGEAEPPEDRSFFYQVFEVEED